MIEVYRGTWVVAYRELLRFVRDRSRLAASIAFPLLFLAIFGAGFTNIVGELTGGVDLIRFMYPGVIAMAIVSSSLAAGISLVTDRDEGFLREILVAPLSRVGIVFGKSIGTAAVGLVQAVLLMAIAPLLGIDISFGDALGVLPVGVLLAVGISALGILISTYASTQQGVQMLIQVLVFPLVFLAGVFFPVDRVPIWMEILSKANPVTYGVDAIRQILLGTDLADGGLGVTLFGHAMTIGQEILVIAIIATVLLTTAVLRFRMQE